MIRNYKGPTISIDKGRRQVKEAQDPVPLARLPTAQEPSRFPESGSPLVMVDTRGKGIALESPSSKSKKKKRKLVKALKGEPKRTKLMSSAMPEAEIFEVCFRLCPGALTHFF